MAMSDEQKAAAKKRLADGRAKAKAKRELLKEAHVEVASTEGMPSETEQKLLADIADLQRRLEASEAKRGEVETAALAQAQAQGQLMQRQVEEVPTGKSVMLDRLKNYKIVGHHDDGREIIKAVFHKVSIPTYFYKIDMPPCGGTPNMARNGGSRSA